MKYFMNWFRTKKKDVGDREIIPAKTVEEVEEWCKRQLTRKCNK